MPRSSFASKVTFMKVEASQIDQEALKALLMSQYSLAVHSVQFWPQGEESYGYIVSTDNDRRYFAKLYDDEHWRPPNLETTMAATFRLYHDCGLPFVVPALPGENGRFVQELAHYNLVLFPYITGTLISETEGQFIVAGGFPAANTLDQTAHLVARLHDSLPCSGLSTCEPFHLTFNWRPALESLLNTATSRQATRNNIQDQAAQLLCRYHRQLLAQLDQAEKLAGSLQGVQLPLVLTHGDLTTGNFIRDAHGQLYLLDWSKLRPAPAERDLFYFVEPDFDFFVRRYVYYRQERPRLSAERFAFYLYYDTLAAVLDYGSWILLEDSQPEDVAYAWIQLQVLTPRRLESLSGTLEKIAEALVAFT